MSDTPGQPQYCHAVMGMFLISPKGFAENDGDYIEAGRRWRSQWRRQVHLIIGAPEAEGPGNEEGGVSYLFFGE